MPPSPTRVPWRFFRTIHFSAARPGVIKQRTLYLIGRTRVHLDQVRGLGDFLELEVVLRDDEPSDAGVREAHDLMMRLGIAHSQLIEAAYVDLLSDTGV